MQLRWKCSRYYLQLQSFHRMSTYSRKTDSAPKAAVCVIGNEVLSGKTQDTNSHFLSKFLFQRGIELIRIVVIPDIIHTIADTVQELSKLVGEDGFVVTTGGIGPTHDDITYEGVAKAFGTSLELHEPTYQALRDHMRNRQQDLNEDRMRMAMLPKECQVLPTASWVPLVKMKNVYVLPGIPSLVEKMLTFAQSHFVGAPFHRAMIHTLQMEGDLAREVKAIQNRYPTVAIGSYVNLSRDKCGEHDTSYNTRLTVDGRDFDTVEVIAQELVRVTNGRRI
ncbi:unnamed protein product [Albugo candida]|uniref:MoaB/Mog domain-containing protein n=2 Tax=Albugo candida TaxID=65357 RepID=A0A024GKL5_9STRA|nr:unnamed protein product [Albugo candida]|eukprot:CCI47069.1 unnamed protein product [Albugo candida]